MSHHDVCIRQSRRMLLLSIDNITVAVWMEVAAVTIGLSLLINLAAFLLGLTSDHLRHHGLVSDGWENVRILTLAGYGHCHSVRRS